MNKTAEEVQKQSDITTIESSIEDLAVQASGLADELNSIVRRSVPAKPADDIKDQETVGYSDYNIDRIMQRLAELNARLNSIRSLKNELDGIL